MGDKSTLSSRCLALLGVAREEVGAADAYLDRTEPVPEAKAPFGHWLTVLEHAVGPKNLPLATTQESLIFQASPSLPRKKGPRWALPFGIRVPFAPFYCSKRVRGSIFVTSVFASQDHILCPINTLLRVGVGLGIQRPPSKQTQEVGAGTMENSCPILRAFLTQTRGGPPLLHPRGPRGRKPGI